MRAHHLAAKRAANDRPNGPWCAGGGGVADTRCTGRVKRKYAAVGTDEERLERDARELIDHFKNKMDLDEDVCRSAQVRAFVL